MAVSWLTSLFARKPAQKPDRWTEAYSRFVKARYDAARTTPENERYWAAADGLSSRSANDLATRRKLRERSRYECHESNSFARGMVLAKTYDVIGRGPSLQVTTDNKEFNREVERRWAEWSEAVKLPQKLRTLFMARVVDGEAFAEKINNDRLPDVQLDIRVSEADQWSSDNPDSENEIDGIKFDASGNPLSYTRYKSHPGDNGVSLDLSFEALPASDVIHWFRADRPGQCRGIPEFTAALPLFAELRRYRLAVIAAAETAAELSAVMYSDANYFSEEPDSVDGFETIDLERRAMLTLPAGWKISQLKAEQPTDSFGGFTDHILMEIGRTAQMPLNIVSGSSREYNFASGRLDYLLYWAACDVEQSDCECSVLNRVFGWWLDEALLIPGYLPARGDATKTITKRWIFPARRPINEVDAANADKVRFELGYLSDDEWAKREGVDIDKHYESMAQMVEQRSAIGLPIPMLGQQANQVTNEQKTNSQQTAPTAGKTSRNPSRK